MRGGRFLLICMLSAGAIAIALAASRGFAADNSGRSSPQIIARPAADPHRSAASAATATQRLLSDARDGRLDDFTFVSAALVASGAESAEEAKKWLAMYDPVRAGILSKLPAGTAGDRLKAIHAAAHRFVLTGSYQESCSDLRTTFKSGDFNCLTSLVLCFDLCQDAGLSVRSILVRGHVSLSYQGADGQVQIFEPGAPEWHVRPIAEPSASRVLSPIELLGKFYYNRGVELLRSGSYDGGLALLRTSLALDPADDGARENLVAGINNWAVECCRDERYGNAASLIKKGLAIDPNSALLLSTEQFVRTKLAK